MKGNPDELLDGIRQSVLQGDYARLAALLPDLEQTSFSPDTPVSRLKALRQEAERTAACLESALAGIRAARRRALDIVAACEGLTTYGRDGVKASHPLTPAALRRL